MSWASHRKDSKVRWTEGSCVSVEENVHFLKLILSTDQIIASNHRGWILKSSLFLLDFKTELNNCLQTLKSSTFLASWVSQFTAMGTWGSNFMPWSDRSQCNSHWKKGGALWKSLISKQSENDYYYWNWEIWDANFIRVVFIFCLHFKHSFLSWKLTRLLDQYIKTKAIDPSNDMQKCAGGASLFCPLSASSVWLSAEKSNGCIDCWTPACLSVRLSGRYAYGFCAHANALCMLFYSPFHCLIDVVCSVRRLIGPLSDSHTSMQSSVCARSGPFYKHVFMGCLAY